MSLFNYESGYLTTSPLLQGTTGANNAVITSQIDNIRQEVTAVDAAISTNQYANIVSQQQAVKTIIDDETTRLNLKKASVDQLSSGQDRVMRLNDSYVKRSREYLKMVVASVMILGVLVVLYKINGFVEGGILPDAVLTLVTIVFLSLLLIYCVTVFVGILGRDKINFDQVSPDFLPRVSNIVQKTTGSGGNLLGQLDVGACVGSSCCAPGTQWEVATQTCRPVCPAGTPNWNQSTGTCAANTCTSTAPHWNALTGECVAPCASGTVWDSRQYQCSRPASVTGFATMNTAYQLGEMPAPIPRTKTVYDVGTPPYDPTQDNIGTPFRP
jgi:hypothetical protein